MFSTFKQKLLLGVYIFILLSIPGGAYLASKYQTITGSAKEQKSDKKIPPVSPKPITSPAKELLNSSESLSKAGSNVSSSTSTSPSPSSETTMPTSFGPTLSLKAVLQGRPKDNQATRLFVGIADGALTTNPKFLLNFTLDLPASGEYSGLSLAGLNSGSRYTALLKGSAQIATSSAFTMSPSVTNLNGSETINLLSGDLNDDNVINSADYSIALRAISTTSSSSNWNENADLNKDGLINTFDLAIIIKNIGQVGSSGAWTSPIANVATSSASLTNPPIGAPENSGYWIWIPK